MYSEYHQVDIGLCEAYCIPECVKQSGCYIACFMAGVSDEDLDHDYEEWHCPRLGGSVRTDQPPPEGCHFALEHALFATKMQEILRARRWTNSLTQNSP
jgi:hypothetical protein